jgi:Ca2+-binding EF-hand superfamily protein
MLVEEPTRDEIEELIHFLDPDQNGKLDFKEFHSMVRQVLELMMEQEIEAERELFENGDDIITEIKEPLRPPMSTTLNPMDPKFPDPIPENKEEF